MSGFSADWLTLREPYDRRARSESVLAAVAATFSGRRSTRVVDLGCGTGSTLRAVSPHLSRSQEWSLIDNDRALLERASAIPLPEPIAVRTAMRDLARELGAALQGDVDLATTSALLDLVSERWLTGLSAILSARAIPFYAALTYDGRAAMQPADPFDGYIITAVNTHQRTDKGFGPALGPDAAGRAAALFGQAGYHVEQAPSDWIFAPADRDIQRETVRGWATAAREIDNTRVADIDAWLARRNDLITRGVSSMRIGHVDLFASPIRTR